MKKIPHSNEESALTADQRASFMLLPQGKYGRDEYPDLYIAMHRLRYDERVSKAAKHLELTVQNNKQGFIGNIHHQQALDLTSALGGFTPSLLLFKEFLLLVKEGIDGKKVYNGNGKIIS